MLTKVMAYAAFTRPHTMIGTALCTSALCGATTPVFPMALTSTLATNAFVTQTNQLFDVHIDSINKPQLPLVSGALTPAEGAMATVVSLVVAILAAVYSRSGWLLATSALSCAVGAAYSVPPLRLKRNPYAAAACIVGVRGVVSNVGLAMVGDPSRVLASAAPLAVYFSLLSASIAVLKDVGDVRGDRRFDQQTFALLHGRTNAVALGVGLLASAMTFAATALPHARAAAVGVFLYIAPVAIQCLLKSPRAHARRSAARLYFSVWHVFYASYACVWI